MTIKQIWFDHSKSKAKFNARRTRTSWNFARRMVDAPKTCMPLTPLAGMFFARQLTIFDGWKIITRGPVAWTMFPE